MPNIQFAEVVTIKKFYLLQNEKFKIRPFYLSIGFISLWLVCSILLWPGGKEALFFGLCGIAIYYSIKTAVDILTKSNSNLGIILQTLIVLISAVFFTKYFYHTIGDYPGLVIVPLFIILTSLYLIKEKGKDRKLTVTVVVYFFLTIPLFGVNFPETPRHYIPKSWYDRYSVGETITISLPYKFSNKEAEELSNQASELESSKKYEEAIRIYLQALKIEPFNPQLFFELSGCYSKINKLELAVSYLDTAISIDDSFAPFFINRGFLYYRLDKRNKAFSDYYEAVQLDSMQHATFVNLAILFYDERNYEKACENFKIAEKLGYDIENIREVKRIKIKSCDLY